MTFKNLFSERTVMAMESIRMRIARAGRMVVRPLCNAVVLKKTVSMLIVACLVVNLLPVGAFAEDPVSQEVQDKENKNISTGYVPQGTSDMQTAVAGLEVSVGENGVLKTSDGTIVGSLAENGDGKWVAMVQPQYAKSIGAGANKKGDQSLVAVGLDKLNMKAKGQAAEIYKAAIAQSQKKNTQSGQPTVASQREKGEEKQDGAQQKDRELSRKDVAQEQKDHRIRDSGEASSTKRSQVDEQSGSEKKDKMLQAIKKKPGDSADVSYISLTMLQEKVAEAGLQFIADRDPAFMGEDDTRGFAHFTGDNGSALFVAVAAGQMAYAVPDADGSGRIEVGDAENTIKTDGVDYAFSGIVLKAGDPKDENANINKDGTKGIFFDSEIQAVKGMEGVALETAVSMAPETDQGVVDALSGLFDSILNGIALTDVQQALLSTLGVTADSLKKLGADYLNKAVAYLQNVINNGGTVFNCAVDSLGVVLNNINKGVLALQSFLVDIASGNFLKNQTMDGQVMSSMAAVQAVAAANGTDMTGFGLSQDEFWGGLQKMLESGQDGEFIIHVDGNHFLTVELKDGVFTLTDSATGSKQENMTLSSLQALLAGRLKDGQVNVLTTKKTFADSSKKLSAKAMKSITGAVVYMTITVNVPTPVAVTETYTVYVPQIFWVTKTYTVLGKTVSVRVPQVKMVPKVKTRTVIKIVMKPVKKRVVDVAATAREAAAAVAARLAAARAAAAAAAKAAAARIAAAAAAAKAAAAKAAAAAKPKPAVTPPPKPKPVVAPVVKPTPAVTPPAKPKPVVTPPPAPKYNPADIPGSPAWIAAHTTPKPAPAPAPAPKAGPQYNPADIPGSPAWIAAHTTPKPAPTPAPAQTPGPKYNPADIPGSPAWIAAHTTPKPAPQYAPADIPGSPEWIAAHTTPKPASTPSNPFSTALNAIGNFFGGIGAQFSGNPLDKGSAPTPSISDALGLTPPAPPASIAAPQPGNAVSNALSAIGNFFGGIGAQFSGNPLDKGTPPSASPTTNPGSTVPTTAITAGSRAAQEMRDKLSSSGLSPAIIEAEAERARAEAVQTTIGDLAAAEARERLENSGLSPAIIAAEIEAARQRATPSADVVSQVADAAADARESALIDQGVDPETAARLANERRQAAVDSLAKTAADAAAENAMTVWARTGATAETVQDKADAAGRGVIEDLAPVIGDAAGRVARDQAVVDGNDVSPSVTDAIVDGATQDAVDTALGKDYGRGTPLAQVVQDGIDQAAQGRDEAAAQDTGLNGNSTWAGKYDTSQTEGDRIAAGLAGIQNDIDSLRDALSANPSSVDLKMALTNALQRQQALQSQGGSLQTWQTSNPFTELTDYQQGIADGALAAFNANNPGVDVASGTGQWLRAPDGTYILVGAQATVDTATLTNGEWGNTGGAQQGEFDADFVRDGGSRVVTGNLTFTQPATVFVGDPKDGDGPQAPEPPSNVFNVGKITEVDGGFVIEGATQIGVTGSSLKPVGQNDIALQGSTFAGGTTTVTEGAVRIYGARSDKLHDFDFAAVSNVNGTYTGTADSRATVTDTLTGGDGTTATVSYQYGANGATSIPPTLHINGGQDTTANVTMDSYRGTVEIGANAYTSGLSSLGTAVGTYRPAGTTNLLLGAQNTTTGAPDVFTGVVQSTDLGKDGLPLTDADGKPAGIWILDANGNYVTTRSDIAIGVGSVEFSNTWRSNGETFDVQATFASAPDGSIRAIAESDGYTNHTIEVLGADGGTQSVTVNWGAVSTDNGLVLNITNAWQEGNRGNTAGFWQSRVNGKTYAVFENDGGARIAQEVYDSQKGVTTVYADISFAMVKSNPANPYANVPSLTTSFVNGAGQQVSLYTTGYGSTFALSQGQSVTNVADLAFNGRTFGTVTGTLAYTPAQSGLQDLSPGAFGYGIANTPVSGSVGFRNNLARDAQGNTVVVENVQGTLWGIKLGGMASSVSNVSNGNNSLTITQTLRAGISDGVGHITIPNLRMNGMMNGQQVQLLYSLQKDVNGNPIEGSYDLTSSTIRRMTLQSGGNYDWSTTASGIIADMSFGATMADFKLTGLEMGADGTINFLGDAQLVHGQILNGVVITPDALNESPDGEDESESSDFRQNAIAEVTDGVGGTWNIKNNGDGPLAVGLSLGLQAAVGGKLTAGQDYTFSHFNAGTSVYAGAGGFTLSGIRVEGANTIYTSVRLENVIIDIHTTGTVTDNLQYMRTVPAPAAQPAQQAGYGNRGVVAMGGPANMITAANSAAFATTPLVQSVRMYDANGNIVSEVTRRLVATNQGTRVTSLTNVTNAADGRLYLSGSVGVTGSRFVNLNKLGYTTGVIAKPQSTLQTVGTFISENRWEILKVAAVVIVAAVLTPFTAGASLGLAATLVGSGALAAAVAVGAISAWQQNVETGMVNMGTVIREGVIAGVTTALALATAGASFALSAAAKTSEVAISVAQSTTRQIITQVIKQSFNAVAERASLNAFVQHVSAGNWGMAVMDIALMAFLVVPQIRTLASFAKMTTGTQAAVTTSEAMLSRATGAKNVLLNSIRNRAIVGAGVGAIGGGIFSYSDSGTLNVSAIVGGALVGALAFGLSADFAKMLTQAGLHVGKSFNMVNMGVTFTKNYLIGLVVKGIANNMVFGQAQGRYAQGTIAGEMLSNGFNAAIDTIVYMSVPTGIRKAGGATESAKGFVQSLRSSVQQTLFNRMGATLALAGFGVGSGIGLWMETAANGTGNIDWGNVLTKGGIGALIGYTVGNMFNAAGVSSVSGLISSVRNLSWKAVGSGAKNLGSQILAEIRPSTLLPRSVNMVQEIVKFNMVTTGGLAALDRATSGGTTSFLRSIPGLEWLDQHGLNLIGQAQGLAGTGSTLEFLSTLAAQQKQTFEDPKIWAFGLGTGIARPILNPILTNTPVLGTIMRPLSYVGENSIGGAMDKGMSRLQGFNGMFGSAPATSIAARIERMLGFAWEEGFQEVIPGLIGGPIFKGNDQLREMFEELFDKTPDGGALMNTNLASVRIQQEANITSRKITSAARAVARSTDRSAAVERVRMLLGLRADSAALGLSDMPATGVGVRDIQRRILAAVVIDQALRDGTVRPASASGISAVISGMASRTRTVAQNMDYMYGVAGVISESSAGLVKADGRIDMGAVASEMDTLSVQAKANFIKGAASELQKDTRSAVNAAIGSILAGGAQSGTPARAGELTDLASFVSGTRMDSQRQTSVVRNALAQMDVRFDLEAAQNEHVVEEILTNLNVIAQNIRNSENTDTAMMFTALMGSNPGFTQHAIGWSAAQQAVAQSEGRTPDASHLLAFAEQARTFSSSGINEILTAVETRAMGAHEMNLLVNFAATAALNRTAQLESLSLSVKTRLAAARDKVIALGGEVAASPYLSDSIAKIDKVNGTLRSTQGSADVVGSYVAAHQQEYDVAKASADETYGRVTAVNADMQALVDNVGSVYQFLLANAERINKGDAVPAQGADASAMKIAMQKFAQYAAIARARDEAQTAAKEGTFFEGVSIEDAKNDAEVAQRAAAMVAAEMVMKGIMGNVQQYDKNIEEFKPGQKAGFLGIVDNMYAGVDRYTHILQTGGGKTFIVAMSALMLRMQSLGSGTFVSCFTNTIDNAADVANHLRGIFGETGLGEVVLLNSEMVDQARTNPDDTSLQQKLKNASILVTTYDTWSGMVASDFAQLIKEPSVRKVFEDNPGLNIKLTTDKNGRASFEDATQAMQIVQALLDAAKDNPEVRMALDKCTIPLEKIGSAVADEIDYFATIPQQALAEGMGKYYSAATMAGYYADMASADLSKDAFTDKYIALGIDRGRIGNDWAQNRGNASALAVLYGGINRAVSSAGTEAKASEIAGQFRAAAAALGISSERLAQDVGAFVDNAAATRYFNELAAVTKGLQAQAAGSKGSISISSIRDNLTKIVRGTFGSNEALMTDMMSMEMEEDAGAVSQLDQKAKSESSKAVDMAKLVAEKAAELQKKYGSVFSQDQIIEHVWNGMGAHAMQENNEYYVDRQSGRIVVNNLGRGVENLSLPAGMMQVLEILHGVDVSKPNAESYISNSVFAMSLFNKIVGLTGTVSAANETSVLGRMNFTVKGDAPKIESSARLFQTSAMMGTFIHWANKAMNEGGTAAFNLILTPNSALSKNIFAQIRGQIRADMQNERGSLDDAAFEALVDERVAEKAVMVDGNVTNDQLEELRAAVKAGEYQYVIGDAYLLGRGWNVGKMDGAVKSLKAAQLTDKQIAESENKVQANCWLIESELMTESQMLQAAGRIDPFSDNRFDTASYTKDVISLYSVENAREVKKLQEAVGENGEWTLSAITDRLTDIQTENENAALQKAGQNVLVTNQKQWVEDQAEKGVETPTQQTAAETLVAKGVSAEQAPAVLRAMGIAYDPEDKAAPAAATVGQQPLTQQQWYQLDRVGKFLDIAAVAGMVGTTTLLQEIKQIVNGDAVRMLELMVTSAQADAASREAISLMRSVVDTMKAIETAEKNLTQRERLEMQKMQKSGKQSVRGMRMSGIRQLNSRNRKLQKQIKKFGTLLDKTFAKDPGAAKKLAAGVALLTTLSGRDFNEKKAAQSLARMTAAMTAVADIGQALAGAPQTAGVRRLINALNQTRISQAGDMTPSERMRMVSAAQRPAFVRRMDSLVRALFGMPEARVQPERVMSGLVNRGVPVRAAIGIASPELASRLDTRDVAGAADASLQGALGWLQKSYAADTDNAVAVKGLDTLSSLGLLGTEGVTRLSTIARDPDGSVALADRLQAVNVLRSTASSPLADPEVRVQAQKGLLSAADSAQVPRGRHMSLTDQQKETQKVNAVANASLSFVAEQAAKPADGKSLVSRARAVAVVGLVALGMAAAIPGALPLVAGLVPALAGAVSAIGGFLPAAAAIMANLLMTRGNRTGAPVSSAPNAQQSKAPSFAEKLMSMMGLSTDAAQNAPMRNMATTVVPLLAAAAEKLMSMMGLSTDAAQNAPMRNMATTVVPLLAAAALSLSPVLSFAQAMIMMMLGKPGAQGLSSILRRSASRDTGTALALVGLAMEINPDIVKKISAKRLHEFERYAKASKDLEALSIVNQIRTIQGKKELPARRGTQAALRTTASAPALERSQYALVAGTAKEEAIPLDVLRRTSGLNYAQLPDASSLRSLNLPEGSAAIAFIPGADNVGHAVTIQAIQGDNITVVDKNAAGAYERKTVSLDQLQSAGFDGLILVDAATMKANRGKFSSVRDTGVRNQLVVPSAMPAVSAQRGAATSAAAAKDAVRAGWRQQLANAVLDKVNARSQEMGMVPHCALVALAQAMAFGWRGAAPAAASLARTASGIVEKADTMLMAEVTKDMDANFPGASKGEKMLIRSLWGVTSPNKVSEDNLMLALGYQHTASFNELKAYFKDAQTVDQVLSVFNEKANATLQLLRQGAFTPQEFQGQLALLAMSRDLMLAGMKNPAVRNILGEQGNGNKEISQKEFDQLLYVLRGNKLSVAAQCLAYVTREQKRAPQENTAVDIKALQQAVKNYSSKRFWDGFSASGHGKIIRQILSANGIEMKGHLQNRGRLPDPLAMRGFISAA